MLSAVHLNKHSRTHEVSRGERLQAWLAATREQQPGATANSTTAARRHGEGAAELLHGGSGGAPRPLPLTGGAGTRHGEATSTGAGTGRGAGRGAGPRGPRRQQIF